MTKDKDIETLYGKAAELLENIWAAEDAGDAAAEERKWLSRYYDALEQLTGAPRSHIFCKVYALAAEDC